MQEARNDIEVRAELFTAHHIYIALSAAGKREAPTLQEECGAILEAESQDDLHWLRKSLEKASS